MTSGCFSLSQLAIFQTKNQHNLNKNQIFIQYTIPCYKKCGDLTAWNGCQFSLEWGMDIIKIRNGVCQTKRRKKRYKSVIAKQGAMALFNSTNSLEYLFSYLLFFIKFPIMTVGRHRIFRCRSPTDF